MTAVVAAEPQAFTKLKDKKQKLTQEAVKVFKDSQLDFQIALKNKKLNSAQKIKIKQLELDFQSTAKFIEQQL